MERFQPQLEHERAPVRLHPIAFAAMLWVLSCGISNERFNIEATQPTPITTRIRQTPETTTAPEQLIAHDFQLVGAIQDVLLDGAGEHGHRRLSLAPVPSHRFPNARHLVWSDGNTDTPVEGLRHKPHELFTERTAYRWDATTNSLTTLVPGSGVVGQYVHALENNQLTLSAVDFVAVRTPGADISSILSTAHTELTANPTLFARVADGAKTYYEHIQSLIASGAGQDVLTAELTELLVAHKTNELVQRATELRSQLVTDSLNPEQETMLQQRLQVVEDALTRPDTIRASAKARAEQQAVFIASHQALIQATSFDPFNFSGAAVTAAGATDYQLHEQIELHATSTTLELRPTARQLPQTPSIDSELQ
ncbi:hypothetical protein HY374_02065 [Candidatus Berkelbacteria bacterium]|nr:hypothetical protein [Candidatus Berkelbacteria bacterium]